MVAGMAVALQPCPKTETGSVEPWGCSCRLLKPFRRPRGPSASFPCSLWSQTLAHCRGNLPSARRRHKAWISGMVSGKAASKPAWCWGVPRATWELGVPAQLAAGSPQCPLQHPGESCASACLPLSQLGRTITALGAAEQPALRMLS